MAHKRNNQYGSQKSYNHLLLRNKICIKIIRSLKNENPPKKSAKDFVFIISKCTKGMQKNQQDEHEAPCLNIIKY